MVIQVTAGNGRVVYLSTAGKPASFTSPWADRFGSTSNRSSLARLLRAGLPIKADVVPGKNNYHLVQAEQLGDFGHRVYGHVWVNHSYMLSKVRVIPESVFPRDFGESADAPVLSTDRRGGRP